MAQRIETVYRGDQRSSEIVRQENQQRLRRICIAALLGYFLIAILFYVVGGEQLQYKILFAGLALSNLYRL